MKADSFQDFRIHFLSLLPQDPAQRLKIHSHFRGSFFIENSDLFIDHPVHSVAQIQNTWTMRGHNNGFLRFVLNDIAQNISFCAYIQSGSRFIQQKNRCVPQNGSGNGNPPGLLTDPFLFLPPENRFPDPSWIQNPRRRPVSEPAQSAHQKRLL